MTQVERAQFQELVTRLYAEGYSIRQIAIETDNAYATVRRALVDAKAPIRQRGWVQRRTESA